MPFFPPRNKKKICSRQIDPSSLNRTCSEILEVKIVSKWPDENPTSFGMFQMGTGYFDNTKFGGEQIERFADARSTSYEHL